MVEQLLLPPLLLFVAVALFVVVGCSGGHGRSFEWVWW